MYLSRDSVFGIHQAANDLVVRATVVDGRLATSFVAIQNPA